MIDCPVCEKEEWKNVDEYRNIASGMHICKSCGFVTYPEIVKEKRKLENYYEEEYRGPPTFSNLTTGQKKLYYHNEFLKETLDEWKKSGKNPVVGELGSAYGLFLNWIRGKFPKGKIYGTELTTSYRKNAWHEYRIKLEKELDETIEYDMIATYKVLEHMVNPDKELKKYHKMIKDDGFLYLSIPCWFGELNNFGAVGFDIEYYYHTNHINVWNLQTVQALLKKTGWETVKFNETLYDQTFLLKKCGPQKITKDDLPGYDNIIKKLKAVKKASDYFLAQNFEKALTTYPEFPIAVIQNYELNRKKIHGQGWDAIKAYVDNSFNCCPNSSHIRAFAADVCMRYDKWEQAIVFLDEALAMRPNESSFLMNRMQCFIALAEIPKNKKRRTELLLEARAIAAHVRNTSEASRGQIITHIYAINDMLPLDYVYENKKEA